MSLATIRSPAPAIRPLRVMVVDDAVVVRGLVSSWIDAEPDLQVVAALRSGRAAVEQITRVDPDVVILDVDMPEMDGISALALLLAKKRDLVVIMASALTRRHAEVSIRALTLGAADYVPKPAASSDSSIVANFRRDLIEKVRVLGARRRHVAAPPLAPVLPRVAPPALRLRRFPPAPPRVLLIGASTGGPQALTRILPAISAVIDHAPVLITQHMPATFTTIFAEHLARVTRHPVREARDGEPVCAGHVYVGPGGRHLCVGRRNGTAVVALDDGPAEIFCKPAVDPLFSSAADVWSNWNVALVLTGMGCDGARGAADIVAAGGCVIAQDEASSVVWGMPGAVANANLCSAVLPLDEIGPRLLRLFAGSEP